MYNNSSIMPNDFFRLIWLKDEHKPTPTTTAVLVALPSLQTHTFIVASHFVLSIFYRMSQIKL